MGSREINPNTFSIIPIDITAPGTPEQVAQHFIPDGVPTLLKARRTNRGNIYFAYTSADASGANRSVLSRGESIPLRIDDTSRLWIDADYATDFAEVHIGKG